VLVFYHCNFYVAFATDGFVVLTIITIFFILIHWTKVWQTKIIKVIT